MVNARQLKKKNEKEKMDFEELKPQSKRENVVKIAFGSNYTARSSNRKVWRCYLYIGSAIVEKLKWESRDYTKILCATENGCKIFNIKKIHEHDTSEYKLFKGFRLLCVPRSYSYTVNFISDKQDEIDKMKGEERRIKTLKHEIVEDKDGDYLKVWCG